MSNSFPPSFPVLQYSLEFAQTYVHLCHPAISFSLTPFSSCLQSFSASGSFPMSWLFPSGGQSIGPSTSASDFPMNIQGRFPLGLIGLISLLSKRLSRVFSSTTVLHCSIKFLVKMKIMSFFKNMYYLFGCTSSQLRHMRYSSLTRD